MSQPQDEPDEPDDWYAQFKRDPFGTAFGVGRESLAGLDPDVVDAQCAGAFQDELELAQERYRYQLEQQRKKREQRKARRAR